MAAAARSGSGDEVEICSKQVIVEQKRIYFNLKQNTRGRFLKIAEVSRTGVRSTIIVPESGWMTFRDMLNSFITGEATEGIDVPDLPEARKDTADTAAGPASSGLQLWVENLPWEVKDEEIRTYFQSVGPVDTCAIQRRPDGKSRGTAIVRFTNAKDASTAIESIDGTEISGRPMRVRLDRRG